VLLYAGDLWEGAKDSVVDTGHIRSVDKAARIDNQKGVVAKLSEARMNQIDRALQALLGLPQSPDTTPRWD
jgi:mRNA-degrading endonuclease toxin of MazEF toxin-antitoxin module